MLPPALIKAQRKVSLCIFWHLLKLNPLGVHFAVQFPMICLLLPNFASSSGGPQQTDGLICASYYITHHLLSCLSVSHRCCRSTQTTKYVKHIVTENKDEHASTQKHTVVKKIMKKFDGEEPLQTWRAPALSLYNLYQHVWEYKMNM